MAIELAKAYVQIVPSADGISGALTDIMDDEADKAGKSSGKKLASGIGSALMGGATAIGAGVAAGVGAIGSLSKSALSAFADYEQLTGGVETLFGDSASVIIEYANNAYRTAGMSANKYMDTVTSFSASLLQSLDGDTAAAAQYAQTAITDMADNANKMGTSIESIQNAYQGFAKQNYTMLDNLKLGYGGTKSEMQRLLEDATELSGIEYDIDSYADVVAAIHVVQTELKISGITAEEAAEAIANGTMTEEEALNAMGTTAKEASTTITGSIGAMKSAWANFLTSMNGSPEQIEASTNALIDSVVTTAGNIIPKLTTIIPNIINGLGSIVSALMPQIPSIIETLLPALVEGATTLVQQLVAVLPDILSSLSVIIPTLIDTITTTLPMLVDAAIDIVLSLAKGIIDALPKLVPAAVDMILGIVDALLSNLGELINVAFRLIYALAIGLVEAVPVLLDKLPVIIENLVTSLVENAPMLIEASIQLMLGLANGLIKAIPSLILAIPKIIKALIDGIKNAVKDFKEIGPDLVAGLWQGIKDSWSNLVSNVKDLGSNLISGVKGIFGIHSPSKEFANIGEMCDAGLAEGLGGMKTTIADTKDMLADEMNNGFGINASVKLSKSLSNGNALNGSYTTNGVNSGQIAAAVYDALSNLKLTASLSGSPNSRKWFEDMRVEAKLFKNRTGQEAFV